MRLLVLVSTAAIQTTGAPDDDQPTAPTTIANERASFTALGCPRPAPFHSVALAVSPNGSHILGLSRGQAGLREPSELIRWGPNRELESLGTAAFEALGRSGADLRDFVTAIGNDGSVAVALALVEDGKSPAIWLSGSGVRSLGSFIEPRIGFTYLNGVSAEGDEFFGRVTIVPENINVFRSDGEIRLEAFLFQNEKVTLLPSLSGHLQFRQLLHAKPEDVNRSKHSRVMAVSPSRRFVVGHGMTAMCFDEAFIWSEEDGIRPLGALPAPEPSSRPVAVSDTGIVIGSASSPVGEQTFVWSPEDGVKALGDLPGGNRPGSEFASRPTGISADGRVAIGWGTTDHPGRTAWIWLGGDDLLDLNEFVRIQLGLDLSGWRLNVAYAISDDGRTIVGFGVNPRRKTEAWVLRLHVDPTELVKE